MDFIDIQKVTYPDLSNIYDSFGELYSKKLWHQLSIALQDFVWNSTNVRGENMFELYSGFITKFETRLSPVRLAQIVSSIGHSFSDPTRSIDFYNGVLSNRARLGHEASMIVDMDVVIMKLKLNLLDDAKVLLENSKEKLPLISSTETVVFSKFHKSMAEYRKVVGPPKEFYKSALLFLSYTQVEQLSQEDRYNLATDMALAAISSDEIYNFGEVIATPVLVSLLNTPNEWLYNLVTALHTGDIETFNTTVDGAQSAYFQQPVLVSRHEFIKQKVVLLCLMNMVFQRHSHDRCIAFQDIAKKSAIPLEQVEWVLMKAMSIGLIKGEIDEVSQQVNVSWVQPKTLTKPELSLLCEQLETWTEKVKTSLVTMEDHTPELYV